MEEENDRGAIGVMTRGKTWLRTILKPHQSSDHLQVYERGSPDFSCSPSNYNLIKRGSLTTQDLNPGALLGFDPAPRRDSEFKTMEDYSTELVHAEDTKKNELLQKLDTMTATLKEFEASGSERTSKSDEEIFSLDIDVSVLAPQPASKAPERSSKSESSAISRFLPNHWLFAKSGEEDHDGEEEEKSKKSRKTSDGKDSSATRRRPITNTTKSMLERREINVFVPQGM